MARFTALQEQVGLLGGMIERFRPERLKSMRPITEFVDVRRASRPQTFKEATDVSYFV